MDPASTALDSGHVLMGGSPLRLLHVTSRASAVVKKWQAGVAVGDRRNEQVLARRLVSSGVFLPLPGVGRFVPTDVTVVIPVRDRVGQLQTLLGALKGLLCVVVDDASSDPSRTQDVAREFGAGLVVLATNSGPSVARNAGLAQVGTPLVAFIDSDCVPDDGWLEPLLGYFDDPIVAAVAPRIVPNPPTSGGSWARYETARSSLDRGSRPGLVRPYSRIPYVPSAALVVRRDAVADDLFDPQLRGGEDVDLVWRLVSAGWDVRYDPRSTVRHDGPQSLRAWLGRRAFYGTTAGPLARRHPGLLSPLQTSAWTAGVWALAAARRPFLAAAALATSVALLARRLDGVVDQPLKVAGRIAGGGTLTSALPALNGLGRAWSPALFLALGWRRTRRAAALALLLPALGDWMTERQRPVLDPLRYAALHVADDLAYGVGVWRGCLTARTVAPLVPRIAFRSRVWTNRKLPGGTSGDADR
jgi:mycofactocin glycosyltransferase